MTHSAGKFSNVILCDDIRDEIGNKKSLMGVIAGDIVVPSFPATIKIAFFMEYQLGPDDGDRLSAEFRLLQDNTEIAKGRFEAAATPNAPAILVVPTALMACEKEMNIRVLVALNGAPEQEILNRKVLQAQTT